MTSAAIQRKMVSPEPRTDWVATARQAMNHEAAAIHVAASRLDSRFNTAVHHLLACTGKVVVSGLGKSGLIARKIAATLSSTGTPAVFVHPAEAMHGDLGAVQSNDAALLLSKNGTTPELLSLASELQAMGVTRIGILGNSCSPLARELDIALDASVACEADPFGLVPTTSTAVALALGDALAVALMTARGFSREDFLRCHPAGQLGRNLRCAVRDAMHGGDEVAWVSPDDSLRHVVIAMTKHPLGAACVIDDDRSLIGLLTDGDLRRALQAHDDIRALSAKDVMTRQPVTIAVHATLQDAARRMEDRPSQLSVLPVVDGGRCLGLIRIHDLYGSH